MVFVMANLDALIICLDLRAQLTEHPATPQTYSEPKFFFIPIVEQIRGKSIGINTYITNQEEKDRTNAKINWMVPIGILSSFNETTFATFKSSTF